MLKGYYYKCIDQGALHLRDHVVRGIKPGSPTSKAFAAAHWTISEVASFNYLNGGGQIITVKRK